jgi:hypothetical protein
MVNAQPQLSPDAMQEDMAFLVQTIKETNPHLFIRQQVTGTDIYKEIEALQQASENIGSFEEFYYLAQRILLLCQDQHDNLRGHYPQGIEKANPFITEEAIAISATCSQTYDFYLPENSVGIDYADGAYFFPVTHYDEEGTVVIPAGAKWLRINDMEIDEYVERFNRPVDNSVRWDSQHHKYYTTRIYFPFITGMTDEYRMDITYSLRDSIRTLHYQGTQIQRNAPEDEAMHKVLYFPGSNLLYIRIPAMDMADADFYTRRILQHKNDHIQKVVIDIRSNGGGNDQLWEHVLSTVVQNPLAAVREKVYVKNTPAIRNYLSAMHNTQISEQDTLTIGPDTFALITDSEERPEAPSLGYKGKIYVLVNRHCFSSALAFSATCNRIETIYTVGEPSGYIGGRGITPLFFSLPHSHLIFSISPALDATGVHTLEDYYDRHVEIPVSLSIEDRIAEIEYEGERYGEAFLFNHDPVFQKVLEENR